MKLLISISLFTNLLLASFVNTGTFVPYFNKEQVSESGETKKFELNPYIGYGTNIHLSGLTYFNPEIAYSYILGNEDGVREDIIFLNYHFSYYSSQSLIFKYGLTTYWWRIKGSGGTKRLKNGNEYTNFRLPDKTTTSYITVLVLGVESFFQQDKSVRFDLNAMNSLEFDESVYNYILSVSFYL